MRRELRRLCAGLLVAVCWLVLPLLSANAQETGPHSTDSYFTPQRHQWGFQSERRLGIRRSQRHRAARQFPRQERACGQRYRAEQRTGLSTLQLPSLRTTFWFDPVNAIQLQGRYFVNYGAAGMHRTLYFNGDTIPPNQLLSSGASAGSPSTCISAGERRCTSDTMICCRPCCADGTPAPASGLNSSISTSASATAIRA